MGKRCCGVVPSKRWRLDPQGSYAGPGHHQLRELNNAGPARHTIPEDCQTHFSGLLPLATTMLPEKATLGIQIVRNLTQSHNPIKQPDSGNA